jgi:hypothetical protein
MPPSRKEIAMRRILLSTLVLACCSLLVTATAECKGKPGGGGGGSATGTFQSVNGSGVTGHVSLSGGSSSTKISLSLSGLQENVEYVASWSTTVACDMGNLPPAGAFYRIRGDKKGSARVSATVSVAFDQIHSIAIQQDMGNGLSLVACAPVN